MLTGRLFLSVCLMAAVLPATLRGQLKPMGQAGTTRAVVIGVSEYQNERIPRLKYAHADADAFAGYLRSAAGGALPEAQIKLLTNKQATQGQMATALTWLMEESAEGDIAIIYFSGHGDMETQTAMNHGFLLTYDSPASTYMAGGAFPVFFLQSIIQTLSTQKKAQVILVTDACHAGKLAGSINRGTQATAQLLAEQFAHEARLLSCQPDEFSAEGPQWGGGHGVFTFYLLDGLMGLADANGDLSVTLMELQRFLEDQVPTAVSPDSQIPLIYGNKGIKMAKVDPPTLALLKEKRAMKEDQRHQVVVSRSATQTTLEDSVALAMYRRFKIALQEKHLLYPTQESAYALYMLLKDKPAVKAYQQDMRLNLAAALQDDAQQAINDYLAANPLELRRRWSLDARYEQYPEYLYKAAEILGEEHFMYQALKTRALYFSGLNLRLQGERERQKALYSQAAEMQYQALALDSSAAYAYNELGLLARRQGDFAGSIDQFHKALTFSPTWVLAETNLCGSYVDMGQVELAAQACLRALQNDSTFALAHHNLGFVYEKGQRPQDAVASYLKALQFAPDYTLTHRSLGNVYYEMGDKVRAKASWQNCIRLDPRQIEALYSLGYVSNELGEPRQALEYFHALLAVDSNDVDAYLRIAEIQMDATHFVESEEAVQAAIFRSPDSSEAYYVKARLRIAQKQTQAALEALETAVQKGFRDEKRIREDNAFGSLRKNMRFKALAKAISGSKAP